MTFAADYVGGGRATQPLSPVAMAQGGQGADENYGVDLVKRRKQYQEAVHAKRAERQEARESEHYYHSDQWTAEERAKLGKRFQPVVTYNRIARKINGVAGVIMRLRQDPKAYPRTQQHEQGADLATVTMRYVLDQARWEDIEAAVVLKAGMRGIGCVALELEPGDSGQPGDHDIGLEVVGDAFFYDPRSERADFSDARYMGIAKWLDEDVAVEMFPEHAESLRSLVSSGSDLDLDDSDKEQVWVNLERKRIRIVEHWYIEKGEWRYCYYTADIVLSAGPSFFYDNKRKTMCRFIAWSAFIDHDNDRYGFVRNFKSAQDEVNARRSKGLHLASSRRVVTEERAVEDVERARIEVSRPDGWVEVKRGYRFDFDDAARHAEMQANMGMLEEAKAEIDQYGPTNALVGDAGKSASGRAIALNQQAGLAELGPFLSNYRGWKLRIYRAIWSNIQQHWKAERWVRVTDDQGMAQFVQVNGVGLDQFGRSTLINHLGALDVDLNLDEGPDTTTTLQDTMELLESLAAAGVPVPPEAVIEMSALPQQTKQRIMQMLEAARQPPPAPPPDPVQEAVRQAAAQTDIAMGQANLRRTNAQATREELQATQMAAQMAAMGMVPPPGPVAPGAGPGPSPAGPAPTLPPAGLAGAGLSGF